MRKPMIAGLAVASFTAIAYAQNNVTQQPSTPSLQEQVRQFTAQLNNLRCVDQSGGARKLEETTSIGPMEFRCVQTYGDGLKSAGASWIQVTPAGGPYRYLPSN